MTNLKKIVSGFLITALPLTGFAASTTFYILNSGDSVKNPITINNAVLKYSNPMHTTDCTGEDDLNSVVPFNQVKTGQQLTVTFDPHLADYCYTSSPNGAGPEQFTLQILNVDGQSIDQKCEISGDYLTSQSDSNSGYTIKITETADHFFCEYPIGIAKKRK